MIFDRDEQIHRDDLANAIKGGAKPTGTRIEKLRWIVEHHQSARVDGCFVDALTAQACVRVYEALNEENRAKFAAMTMRKMGSLAWKLVK